MEISILIVWLALCGVAAYIAANKGRSGAGIFFLSFFLSPLVGIIVAAAMSPDPAAQGKKKCPNCAEFVQPDAKTCRFCQHSFVEEEAADRARREAEQAAARARQQRQYETQQAAEAAKPWLQRNEASFAITILATAFVGGLISYGVAHLAQGAPSASVVDAASENKTAPPTWVTEERSKVPKSVWDKRVSWAVRHYCYFTAMSRDEIVQALGKPTEEASYSLTYKRQTEDCARYNGDACAEYKTDQEVIFLKNGYEDEQLRGDTGCRTLYGKHQFLGLEIPDFKLSKANAPERMQPTVEEQPLWSTRESCESHGRFWIETDTDTQQRGCWSQPLPTEDR